MSFFMSRYCCSIDDNISGSVNPVIHSFNSRAVDDAKRRTVYLLKELPELCDNSYFDKCTALTAQ